MSDDTEKNENHLYQTRSVSVKNSDKAYGYCDLVTALTNNLENAVLFRIRQVMFATFKDPSALSVNEISIMDEIRNALSKMGAKFQMPTKGKFFLGYEFLEKLLSVTKNPDMYAEGLSRHTAQHAIKNVVRNMKSYYSSHREWKKNPSKFTGEPMLPGYHKKGGHCTAIISNQEAVLKDIDGNWFLKLPYISKMEDWIPFGKVIPGVRLKEVKIVPEHGTYIITVILQSIEEKPTVTDNLERIAAIDTGVENLMAVTNNCGLDSILYKGGVCKSINQWYNKRAAKLVSEQMLKTGKKFVPTNEYYRLTRKRNNRIKDLMLKTAKHFIQWCVENRIDTVVMGYNPGQKQEIDLGDSNNQKFVQIPFSLLRNIISYLCERSGIRYVEQEESYTSKASFIDGDYIPVYGVDDGNAVFSGKRGPCSYKDVRKDGGFRGLYRTKDGSIINSDLNGSANILRKAFPNAFKNGILPNFGKPLIFKHPEFLENIINTVVNLSDHYVVSKSRLRRINAKYASV